MWKWGIALLDFTINSIISSVSKLGSIDEILYLCKSSKDSISTNRSYKLSLYCLPKSPILIPLNTISFVPFDIILFNSLIVSFTLKLRLDPLAFGIVQ